MLEECSVNIAELSSCSMYSPYSLNPSMTFHSKIKILTIYVKTELEGFNQEMKNEIAIFQIGSELFKIPTTGRILWDLLNQQ